MWFKKYGWDSNPFFVRPTPFLVGLERAKETLTEFVLSENVCLISGSTGSGKTSLLLWLRKALGKTHKCIYINSIEVSQAADLTAKLRKSRSWLDKLFFRKYPKKAVLTVDDAQTLKTDVSENVKVLWDGEQLSSVILTSTARELPTFTDSFKKRIGSRILSLTNLTKSEAVDLVNLRAGSKNPFDIDALEKLIELAEYKPRRILEFCEHLCRACGGKGVKTINRADVEDVISQLKTTKLVSHEIVKPTKLTKTTKMLRKRKLSPLQTKIVDLLKNGEKTLSELSTKTGSSRGSVGKQISVLRSKNLVRVTKETRPKKYALTNTERK